MLCSRSAQDYVDHKHFCHGHFTGRICELIHCSQIWNGFVDKTAAGYAAGLMVLCVWIAGVDWKAVRDFVDATDSLHEFAHPEGIAQPHDG